MSCLSPTGSSPIPPESSPPVEATAASRLPRTDEEAIVSATAEAAIASQASSRSALSGLGALFNLFTPAKPLPSRYKEPRLIREAPTPPTEPNPLDRSKASKWVAAFDPSLHALIRKLLDNVHYVPYEEFLTSLKSSFSQFESFLRELPPESTYLSVFESDKSSFWVTQHANQLLEKKPSRCVEFGTGAAAYGGYLDELAKKEEKPPSHVAFFEDACYSGKQMSTYLRDLLEATQERLDEGQSLPKISIVCPYMTDFSKEKITEVKADFPELELHLFSSTRIATVAEAMGPADSDRLAELFWNKEIRRDRTTGAAFYPNPFAAGPYSRGNIWFQHKVPNLLSFVDPLVRGVVYKSRPLHYTEQQQEEASAVGRQLAERTPYFPGKSLAPLIQSIVPVYKTGEARAGAGEARAGAGEARAGAGEAGAGAGEAGAGAADGAGAPPTIFQAGKRRR